MKPLILNTTERTIMLILALVLAAVSVVCEVLLFTEQTTLPIDKALAGIIGLALVCFQFLFAATAPKLWQAKKHVAAGAMYFITAILFTISLSATAGFFESRYQDNQQTQIQSSNDYILKKSVVEDLAQQEKTLTESAAKSKENGNTWNAGQLLIQADKISTLRREAINNLNATTAPNTDATTALVSVFGAGRWALWIALAALVDLCPLIAFASYSTRQTPVKTGITAPSTKSETPSQTLKQQETLNEETPNVSPNSEPNTQTEDTKHNETGRPTLEEIKQAIKEMPNGEIGVRAAMRASKSTNYKWIKQALRELHEDGYLTLENNKYFLR